MNQIWKEESVYIYSVHLIICWLKGKKQYCVWRGRKLLTGKWKFQLWYWELQARCVSRDKPSCPVSCMWDVDGNPYLVFLINRWAGMDMKPTILNQWMSIQPLRVRGWVGSKLHSALGTPRVKRKISCFNQCPHPALLSSLPGLHSKYNWEGPP
jgi:hypothetical protein